MEASEPRPANQALAPPDQKISHRIWMSLWVRSCRQATLEVSGARVLVMDLGLRPELVMQQTAFQKASNT